MCECVNVCFVCVDVACMCIFNCDVRIYTYGEGVKSESERKSQSVSAPGGARGVG